MAANLTSSTIASTYNEILHIDSGPTATEKTVYSGTGVATAMKLGTLSASIDNIEFDGNTISTLDTNGNLALTPNGTGSVNISKVAITAGTVPFNTITGLAHAAFSDITDQTGSTSAATAVKFGTTDITGTGVTMVTDGASLTRITFAAAGTYMIAPSLQLSNSGATDYDVTIWATLDDVNIDRSATSVTVPKVGDGGNGFFQLVLYVVVTAGQYIRILWKPTNVDVTINYTAAIVGPPAVPEVPSSIVVVQRIA